MCGGISINRVRVTPGKSVKYKTFSGERTGIWGLGMGYGAYNARVENLDTTWKKERDNRGVLEVGSFEEKGIHFTNAEHKMKLATVYDIYGDFAIITCPAGGAVKGIHSRMPVAIEDEKSWLEAGELVWSDDIITI